MSKYTTEVRFICETAAGLIESEGYNSIDTILDTAAPAIFNFTYPIFDESYRLPLEKKILKHFYTREICEETVGLWKLRLDDKMNIIMPYFNQLYESELIKFNPLYDTDIHTTHSGSEAGNATNEHQYTQTTETTKNGSDAYTETTDDKRSDKESGQKASATQTENKTSEKGSTSTSNSGSNTTEQTSSSKSDNSSTNQGDNWQLYADTPQGSVQNIGLNLESGYLTNATKNTNNNNANEVSSTTADNKSSSEGTSSSNEIASNERMANAEETSSENYGRTTESDGNTNKTGGRNTNENSVTDYSNIGTGGNKFNNTNEYIENVFGKRGYGSYSKMLLEFRDTFLNIDEMILNALEPLFISLW